MQNKKINTKNLIKLASTLMLLAAAMIWGYAFVAQEIAAKYIRPFTMNGSRFLVGFVALLPVIAIFRMRTEEQRTLLRSRLKPTLWGGLACGTLLFFATSFQQIGIDLGTEAGKAGFITAMYIVLVPVIGIFFKKKVTPLAWVAVAIAPIGFYLLCVKNGLSLDTGDIAVFGCALVFSGHILVVDTVSPKADGILLSCLQFGVSSLLSFTVAAFTEGISLADIRAAAVPLLYLGICSSAMGYTFQIIGQKHIAPTVASLLMSLESVFAAVFGALVEHHYMPAREILGCTVIFLAVILAQIPTKSREKIREKK